MSATRLAELRSAALFARTARERLRAGKLADAGRYHGYALQSLAFTVGAQSTRLDGVRAIECTARLRRVVAELGRAIERAVREATEPVDEGDCTVSLIEDIAAAVNVLRTRDGSDVTEEQAFERGRVLAFGLTHKFHFRRLV